jgi:hypothetical protein
MSYTLNERSLAAHGLGQLICTSLNENCYKVLPISLYLLYIYLKESLTLAEKLKWRSYTMFGNIEYWMPTTP